MEILLILGCVTSFLVFVAPTITFCLARSVVRYAPYAYLFTLVTSALCLWVVYGLDWGLAPLLRLNATGAGLAAVYIGLFLWRSNAADPRRRYLLRLIAGGAELLVGAFCIDLFVSKAVYGHLCSVVSWAASVAPFYRIRRVHRDKNMHAMPPLVIPALGLINALIWTRRNTLHLNDMDLNLVVASGVAAFFALVQVLLHAWFFFRRQPPPPRTGMGEPFLRADNNGSTTDDEDASDKVSLESEKLGSEKSAKHTDEEDDDTERDDNDDDDTDQTERTDDDNDTNQTDSTEDDAADNNTGSSEEGGAADDHTEIIEDAADDDNKLMARDGGTDDDLRLDVRWSSSDGQHSQPHHDETGQALKEKRFQHIVDVPAAATTEVHDVDTA